MTNIHHRKFTIRPLEKEEWQALRAIRLEALQGHRGVYCSNYERESAYSKEEWQDWLSQDGKCTFGLFHGGELIGITGVYTSRDDPSGKTAVLAASYVKPEYRGQGLSRLLYEARLDWVKEQPQFERVIVSHRESNEASRRANQAFGFRETGRQARTWPDGETEDEVMYALPVKDLRKPGPGPACQP